MTLDGKLEPEAKDAASATEAAAISIAVSLKRIADAVAGTDQASGLRDLVSFMEENQRGAR